jgi:hypothetical protein
MPPRARTVVIEAHHRRGLQALARSRTAPLREVQRARIVLAAADGVSNAAIARDLSIEQSTVRTWRGRFADHGMAGLGDRPRPGRPPVYGPDTHLRIVAPSPANGPRQTAYGRTGCWPSTSTVMGSAPPRSGGFWPIWTSSRTGCAAG